MIQGGSLITTTTHMTDTKRQRPPSSPVASATSDHDTCAECGEPGELLICDEEGCTMVWHLKCVPGLNGKMPPAEDKWKCPSCMDDGMEKCFACGLRGEVVVCDEKTCDKMFHLSCVPGLDRVPEGLWSCPKCCETREEGLSCAECRGPGGDGTLVKCPNDCGSAVHLRCLGAYAKNQLADGTFCAACESKATRKKTKRVLRMYTSKATVVLKPGMDVHEARIRQILSGSAHGVMSVQAITRFLDLAIEGSGG
jgi:hypothetical protein